MRSIRVYLIALVGVCLLLAAVAFSLIVAQANATTRQQSEAQARETARALSQAVDQELQRAAGVLAALRASEAAGSRNWAAVDRQARAALSRRDAWIVVHDRNGQQWVNTRLPIGSALPKPPPPAEMWRELASGNQHICNLVRGNLERNIVCVDVPLGPGPQPEYAISVIFRPQAFGSIITRENVGNGNIAVLIDRTGKVIWRNIKPERFVGQSATGPMLAAITSPTRAGTLETKSLEGVDMLSAYYRSRLSGWTVVAGSPITQVNAVSRQAIFRGSVLALGIFLVGAALAALIGARLVRAVNALVSVTAADGGNSPDKRTGITEIDAVGDALRRSLAARAESERHQEMLVGELNHRVKNTLAIVQSLAHQTFRKNSSPERAINAFESRLLALAAAHNLLTKQRWESASMLAVVRTAMQPFCSMDRCHVDGPDLSLSPQTAVSLALAVHELATNASKYGALSNDKGTIAMRWAATDGHFNLSWEERGGPEVKPPAADGFGMRLLKRSLAAEIRGTAEVDFAPDGLKARLVGKLSQA